MKKITLFTLIASLLLCTAGCSETNGVNDNSDKTEQPDNTPNEGNNDNNNDYSGPTISNAAKAFVGYWSDDNSISDKTTIIHYFIFSPNGTCYDGEYKNLGSNDTYTTNYNKKYWTYNESNNFLATTIDSYQWDVTIVTPNQWGGILKSTTTKATSFRRMSDEECIQHALIGTWATEQNKNNVADTIQITNISKCMSSVLLIQYPPFNSFSNKNPYDEKWSFISDNEAPYDNKCTYSVSEYSHRYEEFVSTNKYRDITTYTTDGFHVNKFTIQYEYNDKRTATYTRIK